MRCLGKSTPIENRLEGRESRRDEVGSPQVPGLFILIAHCLELYGPQPWAGGASALGPTVREPFSGFLLPVPHPTSKEPRGQWGMLTPCSPSRPPEVHMASETPAQGTPSPLAGLSTPPPWPIPQGGLWPCGAQQKPRVSARAVAGAWVCGLSCPHTHM